MLEVTMKALAEKMITLLAKPTGRFHELAEDLELKTDVLRAHLAKITASSKLEDFFTDELAVAGDYVGGPWTLVAWLLREAGYVKGRPTVFPEDHRIEDTLVVPGDLTVKGQLSVEGKLVVMGDLVASVYRDEFSSVAVGGSMHVEKILDTEGCLGVAGEVRAPIVCLDFNQGYAKLLSGVTARLLLESDHGGTRVFGPVKADFVSYDEMRTDDELEQGTADVLGKFLHADVKEEALALGDEEDFRQLGSFLWAKFQEGKQLLA
jgi:hypothetical protein